jgi:transcription elongation GreA/GreB family factor
VRFGMSVTIEDDDGKKKRWRIVGEDEADAAHGTISHVSPMAAALFGKKVGETATVSGKVWEIVAMEAGG